MRRTSLVITLAMFLVLVVAAWPAYATIVGSKHDFKAKSYTTDTQVCQTCHAPHNNTATTPLWNHTVTGEGFAMYSSNTMDATAASAPDGPSLLCLSCHDGSLAIDAFNGSEGGADTGEIIDSGGTDYPAAVFLGTDLSNDHPISMGYQDAIDNGDLELNPITTTFEGSATIEDVLDGAGNVQCSSCHDVHDSDPGVVSAKLLRSSMASSGLCTKCHIK